MKVGIIGGGFGLKVQAPIIKIHPMMKITAVSTMERHQLPEELLNGENPPAHYQNWTDMLEKEELELLFVSSIPIYHFERVKYALQRGINVVCEKPFTRDSKESKECCSNSYRHDILDNLNT
ncbi:Gfo/Idh/MocA family oxidoreductase [Lysinibacillus fusiformis]|uniref:Gfo/Idh/MocA family oxidoreductase n=2 Tax=Lysinibacillus TaxID=400634 RepID=UPI0020C07935|nr:Gfo/Idh/MocA family oxidoreductase [Lysinibacillus fusiformis]